MSFMSRMTQGFLAHMTTGSFSGGVAAALTDNYGIGVQTGFMNNMCFGGVSSLWGGNCGWGGGGMGFGGGMYDMAHRGMYDQISYNNNAWY